jgi:aspartate-semialdehyde dehydrogenase
LADRVVLLSGAESLAEKEFREACAQSKSSWSVLPVGAGGGVTALVSVAGEDDDIEVIAELGGELAGRARAAVMAEPSQTFLDTLEQFAPELPVIDLTGTLQSRHGAILRDPLFEAAVPQAPVHVVPHPAAFLLGRILSAANEVAPVRRSVATILEPASQSGPAGIDELQQQTISLLTFKKLPQELFDAQLAFSVLARPGAASKVSLRERESRIFSETAALLALHGEGVPVPSLRLVQAPVFHAYAVSLWLELGNRIPAAQFAAGLQQAEIDVFPDDPPANTTVAGQAGISVGAIEADAANGNAYWLWAVMDNLRQPAQLAVDLLKEMP